MRKKVAATLLLATALFTVGCSQDTEEVVLTSKAGDITKEQLYEEMKATSGYETLDSMVGRMLLKDTYPATDKQIETELEAFKERVGGDEEYKNYLESNNLTEKTFKEDIRYSISFNNALADDAGLTEETLNAFVEENKDKLNQISASHILVKTKEEAEKVLEELTAGMTFEDAAKEYSTDGSAQLGGSLGFFGKGEMVPVFEEAAYALEKGEVSGIVESDFGFHIIRLDDTKTLTLEKDKGEIEYMFLEKHGSLSEDFIKSLFEKNEVEVLDDELKQ